LFARIFGILREGIRSSFRDFDEAHAAVLE